MEREQSCYKDAIPFGICFPYLIPQIIKAGEKIGSVIVDDKEEPIIADQDITIEAGSPVTMRLYGGRGIIDERTPLRR